MLSYFNRTARRTAMVGIILLLLTVISQGAMAHCKGKHQTDWPTDGSHDSCGSGSGGGDSGADVKLLCVLDDDGGNNVLPDHNGEAGWYIDGEQKVACDTGGTSQPNLSGINLSSFSGGNQKQQQRYLNFEFDFCSRADGETFEREFCIEGELDSGDPNGDNGYPFTGTTGLDDLMGFFRHTDASRNGVLENASITVRPYKSDNNQGAPTNQDHIQLLTPGNYPMAVRLILRDYSKDTPRVVINLAGHSVLGDKFQGVLCDIPDQTPAITQDATVTVNATGSDPRFKVAADYYGALCTNIPWDQDGDGEAEACGTGSEASRLCNFHGLVKVKFTMDAYALE